MRLFALCIALLLTAAVSAKEPVMTVTITHPVEGSLSKTQRLTGMVVPREDVQVFPEVSGLRITALLVEEGEAVTAGQVLARLDAASVVPDTQQAKAALAEAARNVTRAEALASKGTISAATVDARRTALASSKAQQDSAGWRLSRTVITAPAAGVVYKREAVLGGLSNSTMPLFQLVKNGVVEIAVNVPEADAGRYRTGQTARIAVSGQPSQAGTIRLVSPRVDASTRQAAVRIALSATDTMPPVGAFASALLEQQTVRGLRLPTTALFYGEEGAYLYTLTRTQTVVRTPVTIPLREGTVAIAEGVGLTTATAVVTKAGAFLRPGDVVRPVAGPQTEKTMP